MAGGSVGGSGGARLDSAGAPSTTLRQQRDDNSTSLVTGTSAVPAVCPLLLASALPAPTFPEPFPRTLAAPAGARLPRGTGPRAGHSSPRASPRRRLGPVLNVPPRPVPVHAVGRPPPGRGSLRCSVRCRRGVCPSRARRRRAPPARLGANDPTPMRRCVLVTAMPARRNNVGAKIRRSSGANAVTTGTRVAA